MAQHLHKLTSPNQAEFYTSGRASNEASYLYQLMGQTYGTNNFPDCSNMCHEASGGALSSSIGVAKGTVVLKDFNHAEAIFVFGQNPGTNHPRMMNALRKAAKAGCKIVSINNLKEVALEKFASPQKPLELLTSKSVSISHLYLTPKLGTDMALIRGMAKAIFEDFPEHINKDFIAQPTTNMSAYRNIVSDTPWSTIIEQTGLSKDLIQQASAVFATSKTVISTWAMGLTQHKHSVETIHELSNLHLLLGHIGKTGAGLSPVRGHSNVQGNRTMGINEQPSASFVNRLQSHFDLPMPKSHGHNVHAAIKARYAKRSRVLICLGGNLAAAAPDTHDTAQAMQNADLNVQISTKLNRSHLMVAHDGLILPCIGRTEEYVQLGGSQKVTVEDTFSMVHASGGTTEPPSKLCLSVTAIIAQIAHHLFTEKRANNTDWLGLKDDYAKIRDLISHIVDGFENFNQKIQTPFGFHLTNSAAQLTWQTKTGKATFSATALPTFLYPRLVTSAVVKHKERVFTLQSMRSHDQYNTTIYGMDDRYRGVKNARKVVFINSQDAHKLSLEEGQPVDIESIWDDGITRKIEGFTLHFYDIPRGNLAAYYPETNALIAIDSVGDKSATPTSKSVPVFLRPSAQQPPIFKQRQ
ncbi:MULTISPECIES: FdhF/YdeP family oxidoreductase [Aliiglaciecola]|uniref:FdhF/YdeP family oxidoreductase n=1 Tax=Aliiglaciecola TaxID=1406885 RepID=UPI0026E3AAD1|nr:MULTISPECIES: FdhF/YdeP family oxidoreductase [unclassified Aliiglaciecola]MDO6710262.1 FdhF/YdeP family oxidoreductase [Aliiglaciecola sp. 2_MG-2023]MDO6751410.1 FdhF/YdeP family oxidoreductase [Aliiglaciecola sp. 1_MG-2023]